MMMATMRVIMMRRRMTLMLMRMYSVWRCIRADDADEFDDGCEVDEENGEALVDFDKKLMRN